METKTTTKSHTLHVSENDPLYFNGVVENPGNYLVSVRTTWVRFWKRWFKLSTRTTRVNIEEACKYKGVVL